MQYDIYQIQISDEVHDYVNSNDRGHVGAAEKYSSYHAKMETMHSRRGSDKIADTFKPEYFSEYTKVCEVDGRYCGIASGDTDYTVSNRDEVFAILNGSYYDEDSEEDIVFDAHVSGYGMKSFVRADKTIEYRDMHSLSVGDIIAETPQVGYEVMETADILPNTRYYIVEGFGFSDITDLIEPLEIAQNRVREAV